MSSATTPASRMRSIYAHAVGALHPDLFARWEQLHDSDRGLSGPFLHPSYARAVGSVRDDVEVGVITEEGEAIGFLPFQRSAFGVASPVGDRLCDLAGAVVEPDAGWDPEAFVAGAGLSTLRLRNVPSSNGGLRRFQSGAGAAPVLDVSEGFEAYRQRIGDSGSSFIRQLERKARKLEREVGPMRFEWQVPHDSLLGTLLSWKSAQRRATRTPDVLRLPWARLLLKRLRTKDDAGFGGVLSALYVGDTVVAVHFGLRTRGVLHYWIPAYNEAFSSYSPGLLALLELAKEAASRGIERIDLGRGNEGYKFQAATGVQDMTMTTVSRSGPVRSLVGAFDRVRSWARGSKAA